MKRMRSAVASDVIGGLNRREDSLIKSCSLIILLLFLLTGCARPPAFEWTEIPEARQLLEQLHDHSRQLAGADLEATVSINNQGRHVSSQQFLLVERPDRLRLDALTGFGQLILQLATDGDILTVLLNTSEPPRFFMGVASPESFARFVRLPVAAEVLVPVLLHAPLVISHQRRQVVVEDHQLVLTLEQDNFRQLFYFDSQHQVTGMDYEQDDLVLLRVSYANFSDDDNFPRRIELTIPEDEVKVALKITNVNLDPQISVERFRLQPPDRITIEPLPEG